MKKLFFLLTFVTLVGCSSKSKKVLEETDNSETIQKDFEVRDASSRFRPGWIADVRLWSDKNAKDIDKFEYFAFETTPKVDREAACNLAKANARVDIASHITTFIDKSLGSSQEGNASIDENNPDVQTMREFVENTLAEKIQAMIHGANVVQTYWEKRQYLQAKGAKKDFIGFTCASLIKMDRQRLKDALDRATQLVTDKADDPETKANVKKALEDANENFVKARKGQI